MTYSDNLRKIVRKQSQQDRKLDRLKAAEKSARTDDIIRKQVDDEGNEYVEIGLGLVDHSQLVPNGSFGDGETGWNVAAYESPGGFLLCEFLSGNFVVSGFHYFGTRVYLTSSHPIYSYATQKPHVFTARIQNIKYENIDMYFSWTLSVNEYAADGEPINGGGCSQSLTPTAGQIIDVTQTFTPSGEMAFMKVEVFLRWPSGGSNGTSGQAILHEISLRAEASGEELIELAPLMTTIKSAETTIEGTLTAGNISATPTANYIPQADSGGKLDGGWIPDLSGSYLPTTGKAADSDKLDGIDSSGFAAANHNHSGVYLPVSGKAADADKLDGLDSTAFGRPVFLTTPKTSSAWSNATKTTADRAVVDLSAAFGVPAGIKAVLVGIQTQASAANAYLRFGPTATYNYALVCRTGVANAIEHAYGIIPCDENGDIYCYPSATIAGVYVYIWGYWL